MPLTEPWRDPGQAGRVLAARILGSGGRGTVVLAANRMSVPLAFELALSLGATLDVILTRELRAPWPAGPAYGWASCDGTIDIDERKVAELGIARADVESAVAHAFQSIRRELEELRGDRPMPPLYGEHVLVACGRGATLGCIEAVVATCRHVGASEVVAVMAQARRHELRRLARLIDGVHCLRVASPRDPTELPEPIDAKQAAILLATFWQVSDPVHP